MQVVREDKVRMLMSAANEGMMAAAKGTNADEVFSAYLSLAQNAVRTAIEMKRPTHDLRRLLLQIVALTDPTSGKVH